MDSGLSLVAKSPLRNPGASVLERNLVLQLGLYLTMGNLWNPVGTQHFPELPRMRMQILVFIGPLINNGFNDDPSIFIIIYFSAE